MSQDEKAHEALEILRQAIDAALIQFGMNLGVKTLEYKLKEPIEVRFKFDMNQIAWTKAENENGPLEIARETGNDKNRDYFDLKDFLVQGGKGDMHGLAVREWYCWIFPDGDAVGRRLLSVIAQRRSKK